MKRIDRFSGDYRFLSNFWLCQVPMEDEWYASVEHAYQAAKTLNPEARMRIKNARGPGDAKKLGNQVVLRGDWDLVRIQYMRHLVWQKFALHQHLRDKLIATGNAELVEGNTWGDRFWGVCRGVGENNLGKILMEVRMTLQEPHGRTS